MRVLVGSPVKQKDVILKEHLASLRLLDKEGLTVDFLFIDDSYPASEMLSEFAANNHNVVVLNGDRENDYHCDEVTHYWQEKIIWREARYKNRIIQYCLEHNYDFLFLVDSDLYLHPATLRHLTKLNKDIVSEVFWTQWAPDLPLLPQVWCTGQYQLFTVNRGEKLSDEQKALRQQAFINLMQKPGQYRVGGLGACTLIKRKALLAGVTFDEIYNLDLVGEDRHFCIRAAVLGFELYADTCYPPYHIYRETDLAGVGKYKQLSVMSRPKLTLAMLVRNERGRYLEQILQQAKQYTDYFVILDDASVDGTPEFISQLLADKQHRMVCNQVPQFSQEYVIRQQLWKLAVESGNEWILVLDADELFEERFILELPMMLVDETVDIYNFRLYDMWDTNNYRSDKYWRAHQTYRPFLVRNSKTLPAVWRQAPQHCGRFPLGIEELKVKNSDIRVKHLGWIRPRDKLEKYLRYKKLDPHGSFGIMEQYLSILDPNPSLVSWDS